jgi:hypothetical protein
VHAVDRALAALRPDGSLIRGSRRGTCQPRAARDLSLLWSASGTLRIWIMLVMANWWTPVPGATRGSELIPPACGQRCST